MSKESNQLKFELTQILQSSNIDIIKQDFDQYYPGTRFVSYFVYQGITRKFEMMIIPMNFGISYYSIVADNGNKLSCYARPHARLHRPLARDVLEIYKKLNLHHLIQESKRARKVK